MKFRWIERWLPFIVAVEVFVVLVVVFYFEHSFYSISKNKSNICILLIFDIQMIEHNLKIAFSKHVDYIPAKCCRRFFSILA